MNGFVNPNPPENFLFTMLRLMSNYGNPVGSNNSSIMNFGDAPTEPQKFNLDFGVPTPDMNEVMRNEPTQESRMAELYKPDMTMQDEFNRLVRAFPERNNPSTLRKIGAIIAGMGSRDGSGLDVAERFAYAPYYRDLADWEGKIKPIQLAADNERQSNIVNRQYAYQTATDELNRRKQDEVERKNAILAEQADERNRIARLRAEVYQLAQTNRFDFKTGQDGFIYAINRVNPTQVINTKVKSSELSDVERLSIQLDNALTLENTRQTNRLQVLDERAEDADELRRNRENDIRTRPPRVSGGTASGTGELERQRFLANRLRTIGIEHPEWNKWVTRNSDGTITIAQPGQSSGGFFGYGATAGPTQEEYNSIVEYLTGKKSNGQSISGSNSNVNNNDRIRVMGPNGETGTMLRSELANYPGWKEIK